MLGFKITLSGHPVILEKDNNKCFELQILGRCDKVIDIKRECFLVTILKLLFKNCTLKQSLGSMGKLGKLIICSMKFVKKNFLLQ